MGFRKGLKGKKRGNGLGRHTREKSKQATDNLQLEGDLTRQGTSAGEPGWHEPCLKSSGGKSKSAVKQGSKELTIFFLVVAPKFGWGCLVLVEAVSA
jgi:hypothetical protein